LLNRVGRLDFFLWCSCFSVLLFAEEGLEEADVRRSLFWRGAGLDLPHPFGSFDTPALRDWMASGREGD